MKTVVIPVVVGALGTVKKGMVENIKKVSERATMTEIQKICMLGSARILRKVLSVWTEWLTWVTDALGAWFAPGWCTKRTPAKTVIIETIIILITTMMMMMTIITIKNSLNLIRTNNICNIGAALLKPNINQFLNNSTYKLRKEKRYFMTWTTDSGKEFRTFDNSLIPSSTELDTKETRI